MASAAAWWQHPAVPQCPTVLVVDDHESFRHAVSELLTAAGFSVIGHAGTGEDALTQAEALRPDVVLLDIQLDSADGLDGFDVAERLAASPSTAPTVVLVSSRDASSYGVRLTEAPVRGFIAKSGLSGEALAALVG